MGEGRVADAGGNGFVGEVEGDVSEESAAVAEARSEKNLPSTKSEWEVQCLSCW